MATENKKVSQLGLLTRFAGKELVPLAVPNANRAALLEVLKEYFKDSTLVVFNEVDDTPNPSPSEEAYTDGEVIGIVYLTAVKAFAEKVLISGRYYYSYAFTRPTDYQTTTNVEGVNVREVRGDKVFYCIGNKRIYTYNGELRDAIESVQIYVMTEDELANLTNPVEGAFYATFE